MTRLDECATHAAVEVKCRGAFKLQVYQIKNDNSSFYGTLQAVAYIYIAVICEWRPVKRLAFFFFAFLIQFCKNK